MNDQPVTTSDSVMVWTTTESVEDAGKIAGELIGNRLAACVQVSEPITSYYRWQGKVECSTEYRLVIKTTRLREADVYAAIRKNHPYEVPQILTVPITAGLGAYLDWMQAETGD